MFEAQKRQGVMTQNPDRSQAPVKQITNFVPCQMVAVCFGDDQGVAHNTILLKVGNMWYMPPNAEAWAAGLKPLAPWLAKQAEAQMALKTATLPKEDGVDLFPAETA